MTTLIAHVDDVAGAHGANLAMLELGRIGAVTSGSVMVPGPWFPELAGHPAVADLDLGIHLTLTSESAAFRWRPLSTRDPASGLVDPAGYLWPTVPQLRSHALPGAVEAELRAQLDTALAAGIDVTHLDCHMGAALAPEFVAATVEIAGDYRLPLMFPRDVPGYLAVLKMGEVDATALERARDDAICIGDHFMMPLIHQGEADHVAVLKAMLGDLPDGVVYLSLHCAAPGDVEQIHPRDAAWRLGEYAAFSDPEFLSWLRSRPFTLSGMRPFRDEVRA